MNKKPVIISTIAVSLMLVMGFAHVSVGQDNARDNRIRIIRPQKPNFDQDRTIREKRSMGLSNINAHPFAVMFWVLNQLDLSDEQIEEVKDLKGTMREQVKQLMQTRKTLRDTVIDPNATEEDIRASAQDVGVAIEEAAVKIASVRQSFRAILTQEQLEKLQSIREQVQEVVDVKREARKEILELLFAEDE